MNRRIEDRAEKLRRARLMRREGAEMRAIATEFGISTGTAWRWTGATDTPRDRARKRARELRRDRRTLEEIAAEVGVCAVTVQRWVRDIRVPSIRPHRRRMVDSIRALSAEGLTGREIARRFGCSASLVSYYRRGLLSLSESQIEQAAALRDEGVTWKQIGVYLKVPDPAAIRAAVAERAPELAAMSTEDLRLRVERRRTFWAELLERFPPDPDGAEALVDLHTSMNPEWHRKREPVAA